MASFLDFIASFDPDRGKRGKQFEHFAKWFLKNDPEWATQVDTVWLWNDYPKRWGRDCGIDLVFKDKNDATWAVQAKCYAPDYEITKSDVDRFLSESNRKEIDRRLLIATTDRIGPNARQVLDAQEKSVVRYLLTHFESAAVEYPDSIERLSIGKRKPRPNPRPDQIEAIDKVISGFRSANRGQLVMACGTGKTFVCLWVKERLKAKRTLVLVPSLGLLSQILNEWTFAARDQFDALCICSDQTVNRREEDEAISLISDLPFPVSSDVEQIAHFLKRDHDQVIFSTYQSSPLIAQAQKNIDVPHFDLVVADEAHRCAGKIDNTFSTVLDDKLIKSERRLFSTATPRVYRANLKKAAKDLGVEVVDMSDEKIFGKRFHTLTFGEAIKRDLLTDYRVLIVGVDNKRIKEWIETRRLVETGTGLTTDAASLAGQIGLLKAIKDWNLRRLISFHGRVRRARAFAEEIVQVASWLDENHKPSQRLWADYVSGEMPTISRRQKLNRLKNIGEDEVALLSNARCLSEGVDVPALDGVAFVDPRSGEIDIIQSVGRAIRLSENKTMGTIVIPVFIEQTQDAERALEASDFKPIWVVLEALKSHDDRLSDELDQLRIELGAKRKRSIGAGDLTKIVFDLPASVDEAFARSLRTHLVTETTESWMFWYGLLEVFAKEHGHCAVTADYEAGDGLALRKWVSLQRDQYQKLRLDPLQRQRLEALPNWSWDPLNDQWERGFSYLKQFFNREGHCRVSGNFKEDSFRLGQWVTNLRANREKLPEERRQRLNELGFIWGVLEEGWEEGFGYLKKFKEREGHCRVPATYEENGFRLGRWVRRQRVTKSLSQERRQRLNELGFIWDVFEADWEEGFDYLKNFKEREGHCRVPDGHKENSYNLGQWVRGQLANKNDLSEDRRRRLDQLGFAWEPRHERAWDAGYGHLKIYREREGHCRVPADYKEDNYHLGNWVCFQRQKRNRLSNERRQRLDALGFIWNTLDAGWEEGFSYLKKYKEREGHCRVPQNHMENNYPLGTWASRQRRVKNTLSEEYRRRLDELGFIWNTLDAGWEEGFSNLQKYKKREGHCRVPAKHKEEGFYLGRWVNHLRKRRETLTEERKIRLDKLGFIWHAPKAAWEEAFSYLKKYKEREGHCRVPQKHIEDGFRLGQWVGVQRRRKDQMPIEQRRLLDEIGLTWNARITAWDDGFAALKAFHAREGHCRVPSQYLENGFKLYQWIAEQKRTQNKMSDDRRQRLEALPGWVWKAEK